MALVKKVGVAARPSADVVDLAERSSPAGATGLVADAQRHEACTFTTTRTARHSGERCMSIRTRIMLGFAVAFLSCAVLGAVALHAATQLNAVVAHFGAAWLPHVTVLGDLRAEMM